MKKQIKSELHCDKCHKNTPVRVSEQNGPRLCRECRGLTDTFEQHDLSVANENTQ